MLNKIKNIIKRCNVTRAMDDSKRVPVVQVSYNERIADVEFFSPYGLFSSPPVGKKTLGICFNIGGDEGNRVAMVTTPFNRFKKDSGEVIVGHPAAMTKMHFKNDGDVEIVVKKDLAISVSGDAKIDCTGNVTLTAQAISAIAQEILLGNGTDPESTLVTFAALKAYVDSHVHSGVEPGVGSSGPPTAGLPASAETSVVKGG